jgi:hypothetical protein
MRKQYEFILEIKSFDFSNRTPALGRKSVWRGVYRVKEISEI